MGQNRFVVAALALAFVVPASAKTINRDLGGNLREYHHDRLALLASGEPVRFGGQCGSACTIYLALPLNQTCITRLAWFQFHAADDPDQAEAIRSTAWLYNEYPWWVRKWIDRNGGLTERIITMSNAYAAKYLNRCK